MDGWHDFLNTLKAHVSEQINSLGVPRHATVTSVDPARGLVKVVYDEFGTTSGWLPVAQQAAGNGWGVVTLPLPGHQAFILPDMGSQDHGVVVGFTHFDAAPPGKFTPYMGDEAIPLVPGEPTFIGPGGSFIRLTSDGKIHSRGEWVHDGTFKASGEVSDLDQVHGTMNDHRQAYQQHKHTGVQSGGGSTGTTDHPLP